MRPWQYLLMRLSFVLAAGTGLLYAWMRFLVKPSSEFSVVNHPLQPLTQHAHIWVSPLLVLALGVFLQPHALAGVRGGLKEGRRTGWALLAGAAPMIISGYALQTSVDDGWRDFWSWTHTAVSIAWTAAFAGHFIIHRVLARRRTATLRGG